MHSRQITSNSEAETRTIARDLASALTAGTTILLSGDLGAGKTTFVKGLAEGLGISADEVTSPTFSLVHEYRIGRVPLIHVDLYRLDTADLDAIGLDSDLAETAVVAVEWAERLSRPILGATTVSIMDDGDDRRLITVTSP